MVTNQRVLFKTLNEYAFGELMNKTGGMTAVTTVDLKDVKRPMSRGDLATGFSEHRQFTFSTAVSNEQQKSGDQYDKSPCITTRLHFPTSLKPTRFKG